jgi:hypothetical protein
MIEYSTEVKEGDIVFFVCQDYFSEYRFEGVGIAGRDLDFIEARKEYEEETGGRVEFIETISKVTFFRWLEDKKYMSFYSENKAKAVNLEVVQFG